MLQSILKKSCQLLKSMTSGEQASTNFLSIAHPVEGNSTINVAPLPSSDSQKVNHTQDFCYENISFDTKS